MGNRHLSVAHPIDHNIESKPKAVKYRENRFDVSSANCKVAIKYGTERHELTVVNLSSFGFRAETFNADFSIRTSEYLQASLSFNEPELFNGKIKIANETKSKDRVTLGFSLSEGSIDVDWVNAVLEGTPRRQEFSSPALIMHSFEKIQLGFKGCVADMITMFKEIEMKMEIQEKQLALQNQSKSQREKSNKAIIDLALSLYGPIIDKQIHDLGIQAKSFSAEEHQFHKRYFQMVFGELIRKTPFLARALEKPLGYAGDYGLMLMFYQYADEGESLFYKFMHRWACHRPSAIANKNRINYLSTFLENRFKDLDTRDSITITSVACGPAQELVEFVLNSTLKCKINLNLLDQESEALSIASKNLKLSNDGKFDLKINAFKEDAVLGSIKGKPFTREIAKSNVIISAGLFDYLSDRVASRLIEALVQLLEPGGCLLIGNVSDENPDAFGMDYLMDWNLVLRSHSEFRKLVGPELAHKCKSIKVEGEPLGLNLFLVIEK